MTSSAPPSNAPAGARLATRRGSILAGWVLLLAGVIWILHVLAQGPLASPPLTRLPALAGWVEQRSAPDVAFSGLRLTAMGLAGYLLAATLAGLLARAAGWARCCAALDAVSPAVVRRLVQGAAGVAVAATAAVPQAAAWAAPGGQPSHASSVPIMHRLPVSPRAPTQPAQPAQSPPAVRPALSPPAGQPAQSPPAPSPPSTWVARPGDNLWSIAAKTLAGAWGRTPSDADVDRYWTALVAANRSRLANSEDPDLIFPGQVFQLPPTPD